MKRLNALCCVGWLLLLLVACQGARADPTATPAEIARATATGTPTATATSEPTMIPTSTATPTLTPTPGPLAPSAIFDQIAPSIAFVETEAASGSGILVEGDYLLTNAHVVWPYEEARVVFASGLEFPDAPVHNWDLMADLALLGPLEGLESEPLPLKSGEELIIGSNVYLVGYPGEVEEFPAPTITSGLISRKREWEGEAITFFQTDAKIAGGQSGGALVSEMGDVIGLSGFSFTEAMFGLVASAADLELRIEELIAGGDSSDAGDRLLRRGEASNQQSVHLVNYWDSAVFLLENPRGGDVTLTAQSIQDIAIYVVDLYGELVDFADEYGRGEETLTLTDPEGIHFVQVTTTNWSSTFINLVASSNARLVRFSDRDDNRDLHLDRPIRAAIDQPGDIDLYDLQLGQGEIVNLTVDSPNIDPYLIVSYLGAGWEEEVSDDDSGGGLVGLNADLTYRAPHAGTYWVIVKDAEDRGMGGYTLTATSKREGAPTPIAPRPTPVPVAGPQGHPMVARSDGETFSILVPSWWSDMGTLCEVALCLNGDEGFLMVTLVEDATVDPAFRSRVTTSLASGIEQLFPDAVRQSWSTVQSEAGDSIDVLHYVVSRPGEESVHVIVAAVVREDEFAALEYLVGDEEYEDLAPAVEHSITTFEWTD